MKLSKLFVGSVLVSALLVSAAPASASTVIFYYTGADFTTYTPPFNDPTKTNPWFPHLTGMFFFDDSAVPLNFTGTVNGSGVMSPGPSMSGTFDFVNGQVIGWNLVSPPSPIPGNFTTVVITSINSGSEHFDSIVPFSPRFDTMGAVSVDSAGSWTRFDTAPPVPLPAAFPLLAGALGFLGLFRRRFFAAP